MRQAKVLYKGTLSGVVTQGDDGAFRFVYDPLWLADTKAPPISLAMPKQAEPYTSVGLFPVLFNLLPEGENRTLLYRCKNQRKMTSHSQEVETLVSRSFLSPRLQHNYLQGYQRRVKKVKL